MTCDTWQGTCDMWHVKHDIWQMICGGRWTFSQNVSFLALTVWVWRFFEDIFTKDEFLTQSLNRKCVSRKAPATFKFVNDLEIHTSHLLKLANLKHSLKFYFCQHKLIENSKSGLNINCVRCTWNILSLKTLYLKRNSFLQFRFSGFLFHDRRDIWSSVLRANQINSENGKNKAKGSGLRALMAFQ